MLTVALRLRLYSQIDDRVDACTLNMIDRPGGVYNILSIDVSKPNSVELGQNV